MNDFIQSLSFQAQTSPTLGRVTLDALRGVMRSFGDEVPFTAYRPMPTVPARPRRKRAAVRNRKS